MSVSDPKKDDGWIARVIADKKRLERRDRLRLFAWGFCAVLAIAAAASLYRIPGAPERSGETTHLASRTAQAEQAAAENGLEARRLAAAIATLNSDRDRLFSRLASLETSLEFATDSIRKLETSKADTAPVALASPAAPPLVPATTSAPIAAPSVVASVASPRAPTPDTASDAVETTAAIPPQSATAAPSSIQPLPTPDARFDTDGRVETVAPQTEFGLELGKAASPDGLRALWRTLARKHKSELQRLGPIVVMRERRGGFDLHLVAGPIRDAATAAHLCASLIDAKQACRTAIFDGQRLSLTGDDAVPDKAKRTQRKSTQIPLPQPAARPSPSIASMIGFQ